MARLMPAWTTPAHPICRREVRRWKRLRAWQTMRRSCILTLALSLGLLLLVLTPLAFLLLLLRGSPGFVLFLALAALAAQAFVSWLLGILATIGGALTIAPERNALSWELLRITTLKPIELVGGKLSALVRQLWPLFGLVIGLRLLAIVLAVGSLFFEWRLPSPAGTSVSSFNPIDILHMALQYSSELDLITQAYLSFYGVLGALYLVGWLFAVIGQTLYSALIGMLASTFARSANPAIGLGFALHVGVWLLLYVPLNQAVLYLLFLFADLRSTPDSLAPFTFGGSLIVAVLARVAVALAAGWIAVLRVRTLPN